MTKAKVYFSDMRTRYGGLSLPQKLGKLIEAAGIGDIDFQNKFAAIKIHFGEPGNLSFLRPNYAKVVVDTVAAQGGRPFLTDCNTLYVGRRKHALEHITAAYENGFSPFSTGCHIIIADGLKGTDEAYVTVPGGELVQEAKIGKALMDADIVISLNHFKGHEATGFGGAIKNISIGMASQEGKCLIHTAGESHTSPWGGEQDPFLESMAEAGKSVVDALDGNIVYVSVMNHLSVDCDCDGNPEEPDMHDIGILASTDPVALDQACVDLVYASQDDTESLINRMESRNAVHVLEHGEEIGLGSRNYQLVSIDE